MTGQIRPEGPDVILVLLDDMGFGDLGLMGSEIKTPVIDALAANGVVYSAMYNGGRCCPTRAALLTGLYAHNAGVGHMGADLGSPAYQGYLREDTATVAEALRAGGYRTLMAGKWHVGRDLDALETQTWRLGELGYPTPLQRGFDRFYGIVDGVTNFFNPHFVLRDDAEEDVDPTDYYFTDAITDEAIAMVDGAIDNDDPYFLYLAHAAPHWPLHAPEDDIARYEGVYASGWDAIRTARHEEMLARGVLESPWELSPRDESALPWDDQTDREWEASRMAVYAAMIDRVDQSLGRLVEHLRHRGRLDNTLIMVLSDNGGCAEFMAEDGWAKFFPDWTLDGRTITMGNIPNLRPGGPLTYQSYDLPWANVSNAPFRLFKHWVHEGGISTPLVAHWPAGINRRGFVHEPCHVIDILPTILDVAGVPSLTESYGQSVQPLDGESFRPTFSAAGWQRQAPMFWEHEGNSAVRVGDVKLVRQHGRPWELYDMHEDRTELNDLADRDPGRVASLQRAYDEWADGVGVVDWDILLPRLRAAWDIDDIHG